MNQMEPKYESLFSSVRFRYQWDEMMVINFRFVFFSSDSFENVCVCVLVFASSSKEKKINGSKLERSKPNKIESNFNRTYKNQAFFFC